MFRPGPRRLHRLGLFHSWGLNMCRYSPLTRQLAKWLYPTVDRYEFGVKEQWEERPKFASSGFRRSPSPSNRWWQPKLTMTHLEAHLNRDTTYYFTSRPCAQQHLLMIDVDAHDGEADAWDVAAWIVNGYFPGAYWEPSTNGCGAHVYLLVGVGYQRRCDFIERVALAPNSLASYLREIVAYERFEAPVCGIYGTCRGAQSGPQHRGRLAKLPRPADQAAMGRLLSMPSFDLFHMQRVILEARERGIVLEDEQGATAVPGAGTQARDPHIPVNRLSPRSKASFAETLMDSSCHFERSKGAAMYLAHQLRRLPNDEEVRVFYEERELGDEAKPDRLPRLGRAIRALERTYDSSKATGFSYEVGQFLPDLTRLVDDDDLRTCAVEAKYPRRVTHFDLDIALGFHVKQSLNVPDHPRQAFTVPLKGLVAWFAKLKDSGQVTRSCNYAKARAARLALIRAGMITLLDDHYQPAAFSADGVGIAKKWGLGENCPQYAMFAEAYRRYSPRRSTSQSGRYVAELSDGRACA